MIITGLTPETTYDFNVIAKDLTGNTAVNNPIMLSATTSTDMSTACSGTGAEAQQGAFSIGYDYSFETNGTDVTFTFKLLDTDKTGVIAYLWREMPFNETPMNEVGELTFSKTISNQTIGESISYACKFAFAGGLAVTSYHIYVVGDDCVELDCMPYGTVCLETNYSSDYDNIDDPMKSDFIETCQNTTLDVGAKLKLVAKSGITLNPGFEVPFGSEFIADMSTEEYCDNNLEDTTIVNTAKAPIYASFDIELYPNPVQHHLAIASKIAIKSLTIYNLYGQRVLWYHYSTALQQIELNLDLPIGTYLIKAVDENDGMSMKKIVVQR